MIGRSRVAGFRLIGTPRARHQRQHPVQQHDVGLLFLNARQSFLPIGRFRDR
jgi:hypothetical protein